MEKHPWKLVRLEHFKQPTGNIQRGEAASGACFFQGDILANDDMDDEDSDDANGGNDAQAAGSSSGDVVVIGVDGEVEKSGGTIHGQYVAFAARPQLAHGGADLA